MKKLITLLSLCGLLLFACTAWSSPITAATYGSVDQFLYAGELGNSGEDAEIAWVNSKLGTSYTVMEKYDTPDGLGWQETDVDGIYALDFKTEGPAYFFIKIGAKPGKNDHFLYKNLSDFNWGVVNLAESGVQIENIGKFSHIGEFGGTSTPEPSILILLGIGLLGIIGIRRMIKH